MNPKSLTMTRTPGKIWEHVSEAYAIKKINIMYLTDSNQTTQTSTKGNFLKQSEKSRCQLICVAYSIHIYASAYTEATSKVVQTWATSHCNHHNRFTSLSPGPPGWAGAKREPVDFIVQGKINRGRNTDHPAGRHSIWTKQCPPPPSPMFVQAGCPSCHPTNSVKPLKAMHKPL